MKSNIFLSIFIIFVLISCKTSQEKDLRTPAKQSVVAQAKTSVDGESLIIERSSVFIEKMEYLSNGHKLKLNNLRFSMPEKANYAEMYTQSLSPLQSQSDSKIIRTTSYILNNVTTGANNVVLRACVDASNATNPNKNCGPTVEVQFLQDDLDFYTRQLDNKMHDYTKTSSALHKDSEETISAAQDFIKEAQQCKDQSVTKFLETAKNIASLGGSDLAKLWVEAKGDFIKVDEYSLDPNDAKGGFIKGDNDSLDRDLFDSLGGLLKTGSETIKGSGDSGASTEEEVFSRLIIASGGVAAIAMTYNGKKQMELKKFYDGLRKEIDRLELESKHDSNHILAGGGESKTLGSEKVALDALKESARSELKTLRHMDSKELSGVLANRSSELKILNAQNARVKTLIKKHISLERVNRGSMAAKGIAGLSILTFATIEGGDSLKMIGAMALTDITCASTDNICLAAKEACDKSRAALQVLEAKERQARVLSKQLDVIGKDIKGTTGDNYWDFLDEAAVDPSTPIPDPSLQ